MQYAGHDQKKLNADQFETLLKKMEQYQPSLLPLLREFKEEDFIANSPKDFRPFLKCLAKNYSSSSLIHYDEEFLNMLVNIQSDPGHPLKVNDFKTIRENFPVLHDLLKNLNHELPKALIPVIKALVERCKIPFLDEKSKIPLEKPAHDLLQVPLSSPCACSRHTFGCFPKLKVISHRGCYVLDSKKAVEDIKCTKRSGRHSNLSPGLFTLSCIHGRFYADFFNCIIYV